MLASPFPHAPVSLLAAASLLAACTGSDAPAATTEDSPAPAAEAAPEAPAAAEAAPARPADPEPAIAHTVTEFVRAHVAENAAEGLFAIPPRGGHAPQARLTSFHTVHRQDDDTLFVCADFVDDDHEYDVDFYVDQVDGELRLGRHFLHKVDGEVLPES